MRLQGTDGAVADGVRFCLLRCAAANPTFKLSEFADAAVSHNKRLGKCVPSRNCLNCLKLGQLCRYILNQTAETLRKSFGLVIVPTLKTFKTTGTVCHYPGAWADHHCCPCCAVEFERVASVEQQQDLQTLTIIPTDTLHRDSELSCIINHAVCTSDLLERGFLTGILMLISQAPMQRIFEHDLFEKLFEIDPLLKHDVHPELGSWKDILRSFVRRGYLHTAREMTNTASSDNKSVTAYRFGPNARSHVGIAGISCALKEIESGFTVKSGDALEAVGNKVIKAWYGMEQLRNKNPLRDSKGESKGQKRPRS